MYRTILAMAVILAAVAPAALAGTVRGRVVRADGGVPYESASVTLEGSSQKPSPVYTGRDGMFYIRDVPPGTYTVEVKSPRETKRFRVTVRGEAYSDVAPIAVK